MTLKTHVKKFAADETGAISIEWVVMGGAIGIIGLVAVTSITGGVEKLDEDRTYQLRVQEKVTTF